MLWPNALVYVRVLNNKKQINKIWVNESFEQASEVELDRAQVNSGELLKKKKSSKNHMEEDSHQWSRSESSRKIVEEREFLDALCSLAE